MIREERRKKRRRKHILVGFLITLLILALAALIVIKVFTVKNVEVEGNKLYSDEQIKEWVLNDDYSWNTLYVYFKYRFFDTQEVPFIDTMEVTVKSPHTLHVEVYEKGLLGYLYMDSLGQNVYFDKDGFVVEMSTDVIEGVPQITGLVERYAGFQMELLRNSLNVRPEDFRLQPNTQLPTFIEAIHHWIAEKDLPEALVVSHIDAARAIKTMLLLNGFRIPEDIQLVAFDHHPGTCSEIISLHTDPYQLGRHAALRIQHKLRHPNEAPVHTVVPMVLTTPPESNSHVS